MLSLCLQALLSFFRMDTSWSRFLHAWLILCYLTWYIQLIKFHWRAKRAFTEELNSIVVLAIMSSGTCANSLLTNSLKFLSVFAQSFLQYWLMSSLLLVCFTTGPACLLWISSWCIAEVGYLWWTIISMNCPTYDGTLNLSVIWGGHWPSMVVNRMEYNYICRAWCM